MLIDPTTRIALLFADSLPHPFQRGVAVDQFKIELRVADFFEKLFESWAGLEVERDEVVAGDERWRIEDFGRGRFEKLLAKQNGFQLGLIRCR